jgi:CheY-like chemotaxis protein
MPRERISRADLPKLLIAEDTEANIELLDMLLCDHYFITYVEDGKSALDHVKLNTPDLIILDVDMPLMNGLEVCSRMKRVSRLKAVPILILTARMDDETRQKALEYGADEFLNKPLSGKNIRQIVTQMIEKGHENRALEPQE